MSGDNLHGKQPIKFYSEKITLTKVELLEKQLSLGEKVSDLILNTQSRKLYFFYAVTLDHLFAKLFQEISFERLLRAHHYHYQFLILNHFFL